MQNFLQAISKGNRMSIYKSHDSLKSVKYTYTSMRRFASDQSSQENLIDFIFPRRSNQGQFQSLKLPTILTSHDESTGIANIQLNRPNRGNSLNLQMWKDYFEVFQALNNDSKCKVAILSGSSNTFCTGMDLKVFQEMQMIMEKESCEGRKREGLNNIIAFFQNAISLPENSVVPVIAAIHGHCIGGAVDMITACDIRYCTKVSLFSIKETDLSMVADIGTLQRLPTIIGDQRCRELAYTGKVFTGEEAEKYGLVLKCFETEEEMMKHVNEIAKTIASKSPLTIRYVIYNF